VLKKAFITINLSSQSLSESTFQEGIVVFRSLLYEIHNKEVIFQKEKGKKRCLTAMEWKEIVSHKGLPKDLFCLTFNYDCFISYVVFLFCFGQSYFKFTDLFIKLLLDATVLVDTITYFTCLSQKLFYFLQDWPFFAILFLDYFCKKYSLSMLFRDSNLTSVNSILWEG